MAAPLTQIDNQDVLPHRYSAYTVDEEWLRELAIEYVRLRTACVLSLSDVRVDGITVLDTAGLQERLQRATVPERRATTANGRPNNFDVVRSDFGETICYLLLESEYGTLFGYRGVRDRELIQLPGRGIDAVGVEDTQPLTVVLGEVKVSNEAASPPRVVDEAEDCLRSQHLHHLNHLETTSAKIWNASRHVTDSAVRNLLFCAALFLEERKFDKIKVVACCVLVRPQAKYSPEDYGSFRSQPGDYEPAEVRFHVVCLPGEVEPTVNNWYATVQAVDLASHDQTPGVAE